VQDKEYKVLINEYEKLNTSRSDIYILSFEEQVSRLEKLFAMDKFVSAPRDKQIAVGLKWIKDGDSLMKYYCAFKSRDMNYLNDVLFETAHFLQMGDITSPGCDHGYHGMRITPNLLAANMMDRIKLLLPQELGISTYSFVGASIANILMAIMYDNRELKKDAEVIATKELKKKNPTYCQLHVECMLAILNQDYETFNYKINDYCNSYLKAKDFEFNAFNRRFCIEAHGMYNLARYAFDSVMKDKIAMPVAGNFCQELAMWQNEHGNAVGKTHHIYPESLDFYNRLVKAKPGQMYLIKEGKNLYIDTNKYLKDIINKNDLVI
jgi:hypothetical protein